MTSDTEIKNGIAERTAEIALATLDEKNKELYDRNIRLKEAFAMIEDKDKEIERQRLALGELELQIEELKKKPSEQLAKLQAEYDMLKEENKELRAIEAKHTAKQDFVPASKVQSPPNVWIYAINAINLFKGLNDASKKLLEDYQPWQKVTFDVAENGELKACR